MKKMFKGLLIAGTMLTIGGVAGVVAPTAASATTTTQVSAADRINELIKEKQEIIAKKKVTTNGLEQKALGMRISEIEREIALIKSGQYVPGNNNGTGSGEVSVAEQIAALIQEKMALIEQKKVSTDWQEQKALGIRIGEIEREISLLKSGQAGTGTTEKPSEEVETPSEEASAADQINALLQQKQELINKKIDLVNQKKYSKNKNEQKELGNQIKEVEKEIKAIEKAIKKLK